MNPDMLKRYTKIIQNHTIIDHNDKPFVSEKGVLKVLEMFQKHVLNVPKGFYLRLDREAKKHKKIMTDLTEDKASEHLKWTEMDFYNGGYYASIEMLKLIKKNQKLNKKTSRL